MLSVPLSPKRRLFVREARIHARRRLVRFVSCLARRRRRRRQRQRNVMYVWRTSTTQIRCWGVVSATNTPPRQSSVFVCACVLQVLQTSLSVCVYRFAFQNTSPPTKTHSSKHAHIQSTNAHVALGSLGKVTFRESHSILCQTQWKQANSSILSYS